MTVRETLESALWPRAMHSTQVAAHEIVAQEKVLTYYVKCALEDHRSAVLAAAAITEREKRDIVFSLKRIMEESVELAAGIDNMGMTTVVELMADTYERKNKDYGDSFSSTMELYGVVAGAVRLHDKVQRMETLMRRGSQAVADESLSDTVRDLGTYAAMVLCWLDN